MTESTEIELQAAAFRRLVAHLDENKQVQNIDLMNLAGFCRATSGTERRQRIKESRWIVKGREVIYGMPYRTGKLSTNRSNAEQHGLSRVTQRLLVGVTDFKRCASHLRHRHNT